MSHPHEQDLLLFLGADHEEGATIAAHVDGCPECSRRLQSLRSLIALTREAHVPEPDAGFEALVTLICGVTGCVVVQLGHSGSGSPPPVGTTTLPTEPVAPATTSAVYWTV